MTPIRDKVLVKPFASEAQTSGGLFVPDSYKEINNKVRVIAVGKGTSKQPMEFKEGDVAFRVKGNGEEFIIDGEIHYLLPQTWLIAKLN